MTISYTEAVYLYSLNQINAERSIYSLYHLFQGKKSSQTIQDAHLFQLTPFFQSLPSLTRVELEKTIDHLRNNFFLIEITNEHFKLTKEGHLLLTEFCSHSLLPPKYLAGWKYHHLTAVFWERLSLLIQVCSNLVHHNNGFLPVQNKVEIQEWLRSYLKSQQGDRFDLARHLYHELVFCLEQEQTINPAVLVLRLTGHDKIGLTSKQAADTLQMDEIQYKLEFLNILHFILGKVSENSRFPYLSALVGGEVKVVPFTLSTEKTYKLLKQGYSPKEIAQTRHLKTNTIEDHIVEIALHIKDFDIKPYVHPQIEEKIIKAANGMATKKLRNIRQQVEDANYFEIRLVLARNGDG